MAQPIYMIASDLHGSAYYTEKLLEAYQREGADRLLLLGDILYHGPRNDLPRGYAPKEVIAMLNPLADRITCVRGNCDAEVDQMVLDFPLMADLETVPLGSRRLVLTHGHHYNGDTPPALAAEDVLLHGHTHVPLCRHHSTGFWVLNPGSVSIPKEDSPHGYMLLRDGCFYWQDLRGEIWRTLELGE